jgi:hypothetical protein
MNGWRKCGIYRRPWYLQVCVSWRPYVRKNLRCLGSIRLKIVLWILIDFSQDSSQIPRKTCHLSTNLNLAFYHLYYSVPFQTWEENLIFWVLFALGEAYFHKIKGRKTLSRSHDSLTQLILMWKVIESWFLYIICTRGIKKLFLKFIFIYLFIYFLLGLAQTVCCKGWFTIYTNGVLFSQKEWMIYL